MSLLTLSRKNPPCIQGTGISGIPFPLFLNTGIPVFSRFGNFGKAIQDRDKTATKDRDRESSTFGENHHAYRIRNQDRQV